MPSLEGTALGHYRLLRLLGRGGMAEVYLAHDENMDREVAIKVVGGNNADYLERFWREVEAIDKLPHEHILPAFDYDDDGPWHYLVMLYAPGGTLRDLLESGPLSPPDAGHLLDQIASALQFAHDNGIIHRDIKPSNMLMRDKSYIYLADFGLAKVMEGTSELTLTGALLGTPEYMAPDLAEGPATTSSDIYALGIVLYQMVTGHLPFTAETPVAVYWKQLRDDPFPPSLLNSALSPAIDDVIMKALEKDPVKRFQTPQELADAYRAALREQELYDSSSHRARRQTPSAHIRPAEPPPLSPDSQPAKRTRGKRVPTPPRRLVLPANPLTDPTAVSAQERRTPPENNLPPLPMRPPINDAASINPDQERSPRRVRNRRVRSRRQRAIFFGILLVGLLLFIVLPMGYVTLMFATQHGQSTTQQPVATPDTISTPGAVSTTTGRSSTPASALPPNLSGTPVLIDSLSNNNSNHWTQDKYCIFSNNSYHVTVNQANKQHACPLLTFTLDNAIVQVDTLLLSGSSAGMLLRSNGEQFYDFEITNEGQFFFRRHDIGGGSTYQYLVPLTSSKAIKPADQKNTLLAVANGSDFRLYINGTFVGETHDATYSSGQFALTTGTSPLQSDATSSFNNFKMFNTTE
jgi:serine/threonine protein kinase